MPYSVKSRNSEARRAVCELLQGIMPGMAAADCHHIALKLTGIQCERFRRSLAELLRTAQGLYETCERKTCCESHSK